MRKMKSILGILILSIGILGTGYAYWCDTLKVEATVKTGSFDVDFGHVGVMDYCTEAKASGPYGDRVSINTGELVPGSWAFFNIPFINRGANRAYLEDVSIDFSRCGDDCAREVDYWVGMNGYWYFWPVGSAYQLDDVIERMFDFAYPKGLKEYHMMSVQLMPFMKNTNECQGGQDKECNYDLIFKWKQGDCNEGCPRTMLRTAEEFVIVGQAEFTADMAGMGELPVSEVIGESVTVDIGEDVVDEEEAVVEEAVQ